MTWPSVEDLSKTSKKNGLVVISYWIADSFVSSKSVPGDIDITAAPERDRVDTP